MNKDGSSEATCLVFWKYNVAYGVVLPHEEKPSFTEPSPREGSCSDRKKKVL